MDLPATYYGQLDRKNPVLLGFKRETETFLKLMKQVSSTTSRDNILYAKGITMLVDIRKRYKHRLPEKFYKEHMLQVADILCGFELYQLALWQGYSLYLLQVSSVQITDVTDVDHFMACFFPNGFDLEQATFTMMIRAMLGCATCIFEEEKKCSTFSQKGLCKLLKVLNFLKIMMQAFQEHEHLFLQIYNGSLSIYNICRYLMTMNCSAQALEYLLWASISLELSIPLMTARYLPLITTLYCSVCQCYYDNQAEVQAEEFAKRAIVKINELAKLEELTDATNKETQKAYREASLKTIWPRTPTEQMLVCQFDCGAGQFLAILEALWDSSSRPLQMKTPDDSEHQDVVLELLFAGKSILSGVTSTSEQRCDDSQSLSPDILTSASTLMDLAVEGENKVPIMSAVRFIKLLFKYKQPETFTDLTKEMLHVLSGVEGPPFRKSERELTLLHSFNNLMFSQRELTKEDRKDDRQKFSYIMSDELVSLVDVLHMSICGSEPELNPDPDLVFDTLVFLWHKLKAIMQNHFLEIPQSMHDQQKMESYDKWLWCLSVLCEVALICELANVDCIKTAEMISMLGEQLERFAGHINQTKRSAHEISIKYVEVLLLQKSNTNLLKKACEVTKKGLEALSKGVSELIPRDYSAMTDIVCVQKFMSLHSLSASLTPSEEQTGTDENIVKVKEKKETKGKPENDRKSKKLLMQAKDLHLELNIIHYRASARLLLLNEVTESDLLVRIKRNKVSKAHLMIQKASVEHSRGRPNESSKIRSLLEEASILMEKAELEERKIYMANVKNPAQKKDKTKPGEGENPPPPPVLISRTDNSFTFVPAAYDLERQVSWYQLYGRALLGADWKVRLGDCSIPGTGNMVPVVSGECLLRVEGLELNQKYVFAVAAYDSQGKLLGNTIGDTTLPVLACMPASLLSTWAYLAQEAFQTKQYVVAKRACRKLWSHYTDPGCLSKHSRFASTGLHKDTLQHSSPRLCQMFLTSIFIETEIHIQQASLRWDSFSDSGPFIWEQEARLAECERMMLAIDMAIYLNDGGTALRAVVTCYRLLAPLIHHQIACDPVVQVLRKCLVVLEENSSLLKQRWTRHSSEFLLHMVACITYYLSKVLQDFGKCNSAAAVFDCGYGLLQEVYDAHFKVSKLPWNTGSDKVAAQAAVDGQRKISQLIKALHVKNLQSIVAQADLNRENEISLVTIEDPTVLYHLFSSWSLQDTYENVMKLRRKKYFLEFAALLLRRTMEEGSPDLVLDWGQSVLQALSRRDDILGLITKHLQENRNSKRGSKPAPTKKSDTPQVNQNMAKQDDMKRKLRRKLPRSLLQNLKTHREMLIVENLLAMMSIVLQRLKKQAQLRNLIADERAWKSVINYCMGVAHLTQFYQGLELVHGGQLEQRYSQLDFCWFSLAYSGTMMRKDSMPLEKLKRVSSLGEDVMTPPTDMIQKEAVKNDVSVTKEIIDERNGSFKSAEQQKETQIRGSNLQLDSIKNAALYLQRAMVLAHRGNHWTNLQFVCQTLWNQIGKLTTTIQQVALREISSSVTADQLHAIFTPALVQATDLMLDMLDKLKIWSVYDLDSTVEELESRLHFTAPIDDCFLVDLRWVRTLVLHTLEQLYNCGKWETLAHFALLYNSYTRERYALMIVPLLVHSQKNLLERISSFGGPAVPQPHHVKTQNTTGKKITNRSYAGCQLLSGGTPFLVQKQPLQKKAARTKSSPEDVLSLEEMQRSMSLVRVPLDVEDTLNCYHEAVSFAAQLPQCQARDLSHSTSHTNFKHGVVSTMKLVPDNLCEEDFSAPNAIYCLPKSPVSISTVAAAYSNSIKDLQANGHDTLNILALHELGNLHFYAGNISAAHSCWSEAVDCAFRSSHVIQKWDGVSFENGSLHYTVKQAGIWGCLQSAVLTAKIAQFILTSDTSERTKCCLLSAHFFKCVLCCSMAHPQTDLQYTWHTTGDELFPGIDLFSEPHRLHVGTTVASLHFVCHWLFTTGYYITLFPILALYLHLVGPVCRDVQRTAEAKILKVRALTELCMFTEAITEAIQLTQGAHLILPSGLYITKTTQKPVRTFCSSKSLLNNLEALEDLANCEVTSKVSTLYGPTLCSRFNLARIQLILAITKSEHGSHVSDSEKSCANTESREVNVDHEQERLETEGSSPKAEKPKVVTFCTENEELTPERIKILLLEGASTLLSSAMQQLSSLTCSKAENLELVVESKLLKANLCLQQGYYALSSEIAVSSLVLLQTSPVTVRQSLSGGKKDAKNGSLSNSLHGDLSTAVEARDRIGVLLWLRCRLTLVHSLVAYIPGTATLFPGKNVNEEIAQVIQEGLNECVQWGDQYFQALLMVEAAELKAQRGRIDESMAMLQKTVNLLLGQTCRPPGSVLTLARATLLLSDLRKVQSTTLLQLTKKLLEKLLCRFSQNITLLDGSMSFSPPESRNIYLPYLNMLNKITVKIVAMNPMSLWFNLNLGNMERPAFVQSSLSTPKESLHQSSNTERESQAVSHLSKGSS
ncbi:cilia- and flagella-associated protein 54 [Anableps anableps]